MIIIAKNKLFLLLQYTSVLQCTSVLRLKLCISVYNLDTKICLQYMYEFFSEPVVWHFSKLYVCPLNECLSIQ